jgi:hypothetical protein
MAAAAGLDPTLFAGHSMRRGGATLGFGVGGGDAGHRVSMHGDWRSNAVWRYDEAAPAARVLLPRAMAQAASVVAPR